MNQIRKEQKLPDEKSFNFRYFFFRNVVRYWYLYVISLALAMIAGYYYNWYTTPLYNTTTTLLIKDDKRNNSAEDLLAQLNNLDNQGGIDNEIELIRSRTLISKTLRKLDFEVSYFLKGNVKTSELYKQSPIKASFDSLTYWAYETPYEITILDSNYYEFTYEPKGDSGSNTKKYKFGEQARNEVGKFIINKTDKFKSTNFHNPDYEKRNFLLVIHKFDNLVDKHLRGLNIDFVSKKSTVLELSFKDPVPQKAGDFLNMLSAVYLQSGIDQKNEIASNSLKFIDDQLIKITQDLRESEQDLEVFKTNRGITDIGSEAQSFLGSMKVYDEKISEIDLQLSFLTYLEQYILEDRELDKISPASMGIPDPLLTKLITQLSDIQNLRKEQLNSTTPDNPIIVSLDIQIQNTKEDLLENVRSIKDGLSASRQQAEIQVNRIQEKIKTVPKNERELVGMVRQATVREGLYNYLLQKKAETAILLASTISDNRVVDSARASYKPVKPVPNQTYTVALIIGLLLPASIVYVREVLNDKIKDGKELEKLTDIPVLGMIGYNNEKTNLIVSHRPESFIAESFRSIRTNLQYFAVPGKCRRILITSSISSEGKSFCAVNLAAIYAISGKKVVLVSGDLRKPKNNEEFNLSSDKGISNYLIGISTLEEIIQPSQEISTLDIILSGAKPPNPAELIMNPKMDEFFDILESRYDVIIIDSPPIGIVTDGILLSKYADTTIYVIRQNITRRLHLDFINSLYRENKLPNLSLIFNAVKFGSQPNGYGYGYGNSYGYGYYDDDLKSKKRRKKVMA